MERVKNARCYFSMIISPYISTFKTTRQIIINKVKRFFALSQNFDSTTRLLVSRQNIISFFSVILQMQILPTNVLLTLWFQLWTLPLPKYGKLWETMGNLNLNTGNYGKLRKTTRNYKKLCETTENYKKLQITT